MDARIRILVADDHPMLREGLVAVLGTQPDFEVVGEAADGSEAVRLAETLRPDVILLDLEMPGVDGVAALEELRDAGSTSRAIVFTAYDTDQRILGALRAGARGYLLKGASRTEIFDAIRTVHAGGSLLEPGVTTRLLYQLRANSELREPLTPRELEVLVLISEGLHNSEIAGRLFVTERTVKFHVSSILAKLGADNRTEAVAVAARRGLIQMPG
ncbi:MAG: response regulator [Rubrobacteraceae bacterium]